MTTTEVENFPGFPEGILGPQLMEQMREQAERFGAEIVYDDAEELALDGPVKHIRTANDAEYQARAVIVATGAAYKELGLPNERELSGKGVSWCATCDGFFFRDQPIAVVGGGDSALTEALFLTKFASEVTIIHRRDELRASKVLVARAEADPKIKFAWNSVVSEIHGDGRLTGVTLTDTATGGTSELPVTGLFVAIGHVPRSELVAEQLQLDELGYIVVQDRTQATSLPGVFACGDVVDHTYRQAITAAGSGCAAALDAQAYLAEQ